jgi:hypothetical protein
MAAGKAGVQAAGGSGRPKRAKRAALHGSSRHARGVPQVSARGRRAARIRTPPSFASRKNAALEATEPLLGRIGQFSIGVLLANASPLEPAPRRDRKIGAREVETATGEVRTRRPSADEMRTRVARSGLRPCFTPAPWSSRSRPGSASSRPAGRCRRPSPCTSIGPPGCRRSCGQRRRSSRRSAPATRQCSRCCSANPSRGVACRSTCRRHREGRGQPKRRPVRHCQPLFRFGFGLGYE